METMITAKQRDELIKHYFNDVCLPLLQAKGHDYAGDTDALKNLRSFGVLGIIVRLSDKFSRVQQFSKDDQQFHVKNETLWDTLCDIINYSFLCMIFLDKNAYKRLDHPKSEEGSQVSWVDEKSNGTTARETVQTYYGIGDK